MLLILCGSCGPDSDGSSVVVLRDSAGIRIVENLEPSWRGDARWRLSPEPVVSIGGLSGDPNYELFRVGAAIRLSDGRVVVANSGSNEIRFYDSRGAFLRRSGGGGEGPGEFQSLWWVRALPPDSLVAYDARLRRVSVFGSDGRFVRS